MKNYSHINKEFNPHILKIILKRHWYWLIIIPAIFITLGFLYLRYTKPVYESSAVIQIQNDDQGKQILEIENINNTKSILSSNIELLKSPVLLESAINRLNLDVCFFNKGNVITSQIYGGNSLFYKDLTIKDSAIIEKKISVTYNNKDTKSFFAHYELSGKKYSYPFSIGEKLITPHFELTLDCNNEFFEPIREGNIYFVIKSIGSLTAQFGPNLKIVPVNQEAQTIDIRFESDNASLAHDVVSAIVEEFFVFDELLKKKSAENVINFLNNQLDSLSKELNIARDSIVFFQQRNKLNNPDNAAEQLIQKLDTLDDNLFQLSNRLSILKSIKSRINSVINEGQLEVILIEIQNEEYAGTIGGQIGELKKIIADRDQLLTQVQKSNPEIINKEKLIHQKINEVKKSIEILVSKLERSYQLSKDKKASLEADYLLMPEKKIEFTRLKSTEELYAKYYSMLMEKKTQYAISNAGYQPSSRVLSKATINSSPIKPNTTMIYALCAFLGIVIGFIILAVKYVFYNVIDTKKDIEQLLHGKVNIIGEIPQVTMSSEHSLIKVKKNKATRLSEILRNLRSNIQFINSNYKTISVSSTVSGEGKTFVTLNLSAIIAHSGKKVILIDLDLRKPKIHLGFNTTNITGVSNYLANQNTLDECIKHTEIENLDLMTAGTIPPNPSELILKAEFDKLIVELSQRYDVIIMDTPPVGIVSDGIPIMSKVDVPIYVFRAGYSKREYTIQTSEIIHLLKLKSINVILNGVKNNSGSIYGSYGRNNYYVKNYYIDEEE